jgi:serine phosphatase RsbU (regulator of sigma subunit)
MIDDTAVFSRELDEKIIPVRKDDCFFLFTDGLIEATFPDGSFFGNDRVKKMLAGTTDRRPESVIRLVEEAFSNCAQGRDQHDDLTVLSLMIQ